MKKTLKSFLVICLVLLACAVMLTGCDEENEPQVPDDTINDTTNNDDKTDKPEQHIHAFGEWTVTKEATCTEKG